MPVCYARPISKAAEAVLAHRGPFPALAKTLSAIRIDDLQEMMGPLATYFEHLTHQAIPKAKAILVTADQVEDALGPDEELTGGLMVGLGVEEVNVCGRPVVTIADSTCTFQLLTARSNLIRWVVRVLETEILYSPVARGHTVEWSSEATKYVRLRMPGPNREKVLEMASCKTDTKKLTRAALTNQTLSGMENVG